MEASTDSKARVGGKLETATELYGMVWMHLPTQKQESVDASADLKARVSGGLRRLQLLGRWRHPPTQEIQFICRLRHCPLTVLYQARNEQSPHLAAHLSHL